MATFNWADNEDEERWQQDRKEEDSWTTVTRKKKGDHSAAGRRRRHREARQEFSKREVENAYSIQKEYGDFSLVADTILFGAGARLREQGREPRIVETVINEGRKLQEEKEEKILQKRLKKKKRNKEPTVLYAMVRNNDLPDVYYIAYVKPGYNAQLNAQLVAAENSHQ